MNFKTHVPAHREGTTLQPNIHNTTYSIQRSSNKSLFGYTFFCIYRAAKNKLIKTQLGIEPRMIAHKSAAKILQLFVSCEEHYPATGHRDTKRERNTAPPPTGIEGAVDFFWWGWRRESRPVV